MQGPPHTIYEGENFTLRLKFSSQYPIQPPSAFFVKPHIPKHEHIYTNGDICLSILGRDWQSSMTAETIIVSILSLLCSAKHKLLPPDNANRKLIFSTAVHIPIVQYTINFFMLCIYAPLVVHDYLQMCIYYLDYQHKVFIYSICIGYFLDADISPGEQQDNWMYHDDRC